ncbi:MAG: hypothetical protein MK212_05335 [Saprospiraceae bacterium]|nr:hypothetical protein [Saprospiraceae bacterium]
MRFSLFIITACSLWIATACKNTQLDRKKEKELAKANLTASIIQEGTIDCFEKGSLDSLNNKLYYCEASAVAYLNGKLFIASDKNTPEGSALFQVPFDLETLKLDKKIEYLQHPNIRSARKFEDFSVDNDMLWLGTGFDRIHSSDNTMDAYNTLLGLSWDGSSRLPLVPIVSMTQNDQVNSSKSLRRPIQEALTQYLAVSRDSIPYFKVEGLANVPNPKEKGQQQLIWGIREYGRKYNNFEYSILLISANYKKNKPYFDLDSNSFKVSYRFSPRQVDYPKLKLPIALSSIEYDYKNERLYLLTSYEHGETSKEIGAYLWTLSLSDLEKGNAPILVKTKDGEPLHFNHKSEGVTILDENTLFLIHDDDRVVENLEEDKIFRRQAHQAAYSIIRFE